MVTINSTENKNYKLCQQLAQKKYRDKMGLYIIEGPNLIKEAFENNGLVKFLVVEKNRDFQYDEIIKNKSFDIFQMEEKLFAKISLTENSQGIIAVVCKRKELNPEEYFEKLSPNGNLVILDRLQDPGNIGTIIRTADGAGYGGIIVIKGTADIYSPKVTRAAAGSVFRMPVLFLESPAQAIELLEKHGKKTVASCLETDNYYYDIDLKKDIGLIIGNEGNGISKEFLDGSKIKIKIPMMGKIESLNAAVAAGIIMYEAMRK